MKLLVTKIPFNVNPLFEQINWKQQIQEISERKYSSYFQEKFY